MPDWLIELLCCSVGFVVGVGLIMLLKWVEKKTQ